MAWQLCVTYARHSLACPHRAFLTIAQGASQNVTRNVQSVKDPPKPLKKKSPGQKETSQSHGPDAAKQS